MDRRVFVGGVAGALLTSSFTIWAARNATQSIPIVRAASANVTQALGLTISRSLLQQADEVIQ